MPYFYYKTDGKRRIPLNAKQAEEFLGYSIENILNDSEVEIPTSSAVFQALKKDWNQNNSEALDYISNRTHWKENIGRHPAISGPSPDDGLEIVDWEMVFDYGLYEMGVASGWGVWDLDTDK